jgi:hypothetical protein
VTNGIEVSNYHFIVGSVPIETPLNKRRAVIVRLAKKVVHRHRKETGDIFTQDHTCTKQNCFYCETMLKK